MQVTEQVSRSSRVKYGTTLLCPSSFCSHSPTALFFFVSGLSVARQHVILPEPFWDVSTAEMTRSMVSNNRYPGPKQRWQLSRMSSNFLSPSWKYCWCSRSWRKNHHRKHLCRLHPCNCFSATGLAWGVIRNEHLSYTTNLHSTP